MLALDRSLGLLEIARTQKGGVEGLLGNNSSTQKGKETENALTEEMHAVRLDDTQSIVEECLRGDLCFNGLRNNVFVSLKTQKAMS
jgi:hypothetical protein